MSRKQTDMAGLRDGRLDDPLRWYMQVHTHGRKQSAADSSNPSSGSLDSLRVPWAPRTIG